MRPEVFLDTGIFVAWLVREDRHHAAAEALFAGLPRVAATSLAVVAEAYAWFLHRFDEERARLFRVAVGELPGLWLLGLDEAHHAAVLRKLDRFRGLKLTYVDASSLVFLSLGRIRTVWGTDHHLGMEGARVLPEPA
jgi:predicted nucleic acid-binding protein